jgi:hypothetical protein
MEFELVEQYLLSLSIPHFVAIGLLLFVLILFFASKSKERQEKKLLAQAPRLRLKDFQVAPLGKDAFFKIRNAGETATISQLDIIGRADLMVKNDYAGHQIEKNKEYRIFLESAGHQKIDKDFSIEITFSDPQGHIYKQLVPVASPDRPQLSIIKKG